jgi:hypothetical protein
MSVAGPSQLSLFAAEGDAKAPRTSARAPAVEATADGSAADAGAPREGHEGLAAGPAQGGGGRSLPADVAQYTLTSQRPPRPPRPPGGGHAPAPSREEVLARAQQLAHRLSVGLGVPVHLSVTDNRSTMVSFRRGARLLTVRVHHMFLDAPEHIVAALGDYAGRGSRSAGHLLDEYIRGMQPRIRQVRRAAEGPLEPRGRCFDLQELFDALNGRHFEGGIQARIGWGRQPPSRRRKSIRLGVYDHQTREIRIHPALDRPDVPRFFVEFIVFHEMLHQLFPSVGGTGRRCHHPPAFKSRERTFPLYEQALRWERDNLRTLLRG